MLFDQIHCPDAILVDELAKTVAALNDWLGDQDGPDTPVSASFCYTGEYACIDIGEVCVWDTEDTGESFAAENCKKGFRDYVQSLNKVLANSDAQEAMK